MIEKNIMQFIRDVPDFPKKGVIFKDITPILKNKTIFKQTIDILSEHYKNVKIDKIVSMESRGFIFGSALAYKLNCGFVPVRKKGKLPCKTFSISYNLEYGKDTLEIHKDAICSKDNVLIVDDVLATGGTANAVVKLIKKTKCRIIGFCFLIELTFLNPRDKLKGYNIFSLVKY